jgi:hypothetical protein
VFFLKSCMSFMAARMSSTRACFSLGSSMSPREETGRSPGWPGECQTGTVKGVPFWLLHLPKDMYFQGSDRMQEKPPPASKLISKITYRY